MLLDFFLFSRSKVSDANIANFGYCVKNSDDDCDSSSSFSTETRQTSQSKDSINCQFLSKIFVKYLIIEIDRNVDSLINYNLFTKLITTANTNCQDTFGDHFNIKSGHIVQYFLFRVLLCLSIFLFATDTTFKSFSNNAYTNFIKIAKYILQSKHSLYISYKQITDTDQNKNL